jgi:hypothetical protein
VVQQGASVAGLIGVSGYPDAWLLFRMGECGRAGSPRRCFDAIGHAQPRSSILHLENAWTGPRTPASALRSCSDTSPRGYLLPAILFMSSAGNPVSMTPRPAVYLGPPSQNFGVIMISVATGRHARLFSPIDPLDAPCSRPLLGRMCSKLFAVLRTRNYRIRMNAVFESMLHALARH